MKLKLTAIIYLFFFAQTEAQTASHDLIFSSLPKQWDEALPMGNGMTGVLIWEKEGRLRMSLDRADLWDQRPMKGLHRKEFSYDWVYRQVLKKDYAIVQQYFDQPYDNEPAPTKIPGGAIEVQTAAWGDATLAALRIKNAISEIKWTNGVVLKSFVHAMAPIGFFRFENVPDTFQLDLVTPAYQGTVRIKGDPVGGDDLSRLGYEKGKVTREKSHIIYAQKGWGGFSYEISVRWKKLPGNIVEGVWSISSHERNVVSTDHAKEITLSALKKGFASYYTSHEKWWENFWSKSWIHLPDTALEKQWYLEQYKLGATSRKGAPPISLQAIWTADNGRIPPWKGDFHHDLNTQLSYWPSYSANHLDEAIVYINHLEKNKANYKRYTQRYFNKPGLAVPGVTTLDGTEMGGWIQYALSPTVACWLSQHYYLQWRYSMDSVFLRTKAYPWIKETAIFIENITVADSIGRRNLPISSSPEINDNSIDAWFTENTNYDLSLMKYVAVIAGKLAAELKLTKDMLRWQNLSASFGEHALTKNDELMFAPDLPYNQSHRHFSHLMAIHPLGLIKWEDGLKSQTIISNSIAQLDSMGPGNWVGYSYSWQGNLKARAKDGDGALKALQIFARAFCTANSFHVNGDQTKSGYSGFQYRPFTLEGNFAFAAGVQEMLLQSHAGFIEVFPAVPKSWTTVAFKTLRAEGAFLVSAEMKSRQISQVTIKAEKGGSTIVRLRFTDYAISNSKNVEVSRNKDGWINLSFSKNGEVTFTAK
jgi:alpha-L-fucosidase 2